MDLISPNPESSQPVAAIFDTKALPQHLVLNLKEFENHYHYLGHYLNCSDTFFMFLHVSKEVKQGVFLYEYNNSVAYSNKNIVIKRKHTVGLRTSYLA